MSDHREDFTDGLSAYSVDDEDQLQPEDTLVENGEVGVDTAALQGMPSRSSSVARSSSSSFRQM